MSLSRRLSTEDLLEILSLSKDATAIYTSRDIVIEMANDAMIGFWGKDRSVIGMTFKDAIPELKNQPFLEYLQEVWDTGKTYKATNTAAKLRVDNKLQVFYFDFEYRAIKNEDGEMYCILHTATEVTDRVLAEQREQGLNEELSAAGEELSALNEELMATVEDLKKSQEELLTLNEGLDQQVSLRTAELAAANEELYATNEELSATNDELVASQALLKTFIADLEKATDILNQAIATAFIGTWSVEAPSSELVLSNQACAIYGIPADVNVTLPDVIGLIAEGSRENVINRIRSAVTNFDVFVEEYLVQPMDGSRPRWVRSTGKAYYDADGNPVNVSGTILDITERKEDEQRKNDFIAMASHELKTPLTSLKAYVQMLYQRAEKENDSFRVMALGRAEKQANKMIAMINAFLNVSRLDSGKIYLNTEEFPLDELIRAMIEENETLSAKHTFKFIPNESFNVTADHEKIGYVLTNLLSNAVKYSPNGGVVEIQCLQDANNAQISVRDEGIGILPDDKERLFERYYRVKDDVTRNISGFGIGLYISSEIIKRHNGKIWVESEIEKGSTFYFSLPVA